MNKTIDYKLIQNCIGAIVMGVALCFALVALAMPTAADAKGKPEITGQERAASVKASSDDKEAEEVEVEDGDLDEDDEEGEEEDDSKGNSKANKGEDKVTGLARAAAVVNREEVRAKLTVMLALIAELQSRLNNMHGIGDVVSTLNPNDYDSWGDQGDEDEDGGDVIDASLVVASLVSATETLVENEVGDASDDEGEFVLELAVTASGTDLMIPATASEEAASTTGVLFSILNASGTVVTTGATSVAISSTGSTTDEMFVVADGETQTLTITMTFDPEETDEYYVQLLEVHTDKGVLILDPAADYQSALLEV